MAKTTPTVIQYPGAFGLFKPSTEAIKLAFPTLAYLYLAAFGIAIALGIVLGLFTSDEGTIDAVGNIAEIVFQLFSIPMTTLILLSAVRSKKVSLQESFNYATTHIWRYFVASFLTALAVLGGLILLIVPGIIIALRLSMTLYLLADNPTMTGIEAMKASWNLTRGHLGKIWGIIGVSLLMLLPIVTIIGIIATVILLVLYAAAMPILYTYLVRLQPKAITA